MGPPGVEGVPGENLFLRESQYFNVISIMRVWQFGCNIFISVLVKISALNTALFVTTRRCRISVYHFNGTFYYTYNADRRGRRALGRRDYTNILTIKNRLRFCE